MILASPEQMQVLHSLKDGEKIAKDIMEACKMHHQAATKMLRKLHKMGLITSRQYGKNKFYLIYTITPAGIDVINKAIEQAARLGWDFEEVGRQWIEDRARAAASRQRFMMFSKFTVK